MIGWDFFKKAYSLYLCNQSIVPPTYAAGALCLKSGIDNPSFNFFIVDNIMNRFQKDIFLRSFNCQGFVASFQESRDFVETWSPNLKLLGRGIIMSTRPTSIVNIKTQQNIDVRPAETDEVFNDHISIMKEIRGVDEYQDMINNIKDNMVIYVAYVDGVPAGTGSAIQIEKEIFILDTITREMYQNSGVLSAIGQVSMQNAKESGVEKISTMVTSVYSQKVADAIGFKVEQVFDFWKNEVK